MKYLKHPKKKRDAPTVPWEQKVFNSLCKDTPASEIPDGGVAELINGLLFGDRIQVRPGSERLAALNFPVLAADLFDDLTKTSTAVTSVSDRFSDSDVGRYIIWTATGRADLVTAFSNTKAITVDSTTVETGDGQMRDAVQSVHFHEESGKIFLHLGTDLYYTDLDFSAWTKVYFYKNQALTATSSDWDEFEDQLYIQNNGGTFLVDLNNTAYISAFQINLPTADNSINVSTVKEVATEVPTDEEDISNIYGRRYLFTMSRLDTQSSADSRADGRRIIKESGSNTYPAANDYIDYKESWRFKSFDDANNPEYTYQIMKCTITNKSLLAWRKGAGEFDLTIAGTTRTIRCEFTDVNTSSWDTLAVEIETRVKDAFTEYKYLEVRFVAYNVMIINTNDMSADVTALTATAGAVIDGYWDMTASGFLASNTATDERGWFLLGDPGTDEALQLRSGQYGYTHFTVYSTKTFGESVRDKLDNSIINNEQFIWQKDVRVINPIFGTWSTTRLVTTEGKGEFFQEDVGCEVISTEGEVGIITAVDADGLGADVDATASSTEAFAIGCDTPREVTLTSNALGSILALADSTFPPGDNFSSDDVGKMVYFSDGSYGTVIAYLGIDPDTGTSSVRLDRTDGLTGSYACGLDPTGRCYNDSLNDTELDHRRSFWPLTNRFWSAMPTANIGTVANGFMVSARKNASVAYYCQYNSQYKYLAGHYYSEFQFYNTKDTIRHITEMTDQIITFCKNSTWKASTTILSTVEDARVSEFIVLLSGISIIDSALGANHPHGIASHTNGTKIVFTSEPGIRVFDGYRYGPNLLYDKRGRPLIKSDVQALRDNARFYYEPNLYGLMIWGSTTSTDSIEPDKSYRLAMEVEHGFSFAEMNGSAWMWPELKSQPLLVTDEYKNKFTLVFDNRKGNPFVLCTRDLPTVSGLTIKYQDRYVIAGVATDIAGSVKLKEHTSKDETEKIRYMEEYWMFRPQNESDKDESPYDEYGFYTNQRFTFKAYVNGNLTESSQSESVVPQATVYQPYKIEDRRIQTELSWVTSRLIITSHKALFDVLEQRVQPEHEIKETTWQEQLATDLAFWTTRQYYEELNQANGKATVYDDSGVSLPEHVTGPDDLVSAFGGSNSTYGMSYTDITPPEETAESISFVFGIKASIPNTGDTNVIIAKNSIDEEIFKAKIKYPSNELEFYINEVLVGSVLISNTSWYMFNITLSDDADLNIGFYSIDGATPLSLAMSDKASDIIYNQIELNEVDKDNPYLFDVRVYNTYKNLYNAWIYYLRDVFTYEGFSTLPPVL